MLSSQRHQEKTRSTQKISLVVCMILGTVGREKGESILLALQRVEVGVVGDRLIHLRL